MAIVQISKIIHRTGANTDLPQLDMGEIGFATDSRKLYIGNDPVEHPAQGANNTTQTEILTEQSLINQRNPDLTDTDLPIKAKISGLANSVFNISNFRTGQILVGTGTSIIANTIVNWTGNKLLSNSNVHLGKLNLGNVANLYITGGMSNGVLTTDGTGNLSWQVMSGGGGGSGLPTQNSSSNNNFLMSDGSAAQWSNVFSDSRFANAVRGNITVANVSGYGNINYSSGTISYIGPSDFDIRSSLTGGTGVLVDSATGIISIAQDVSTTSDVTFVNVNATGMTVANLYTEDANLNPVNGIVFSDYTTNTLTTDSSLYYDPVTSELTVGRIEASGNISTGNAFFKSNLQTVTQSGPASGQVNGIPAGQTGQICWDANYIYVCVAPFTWKRASLSSF